jgi:competence protein ComEC
MPLIAFAVASFAAGLLLGFAGLTLAGACAAAALAITGIARRRRALIAFGALAAAGLLIARADDAVRARCLRRNLEVREWRVVLDEAASPGAFLAGDAAADGCTVRASLAVVRGSARAGDAVRVRGEPSAAPRGIRIAHATLSPDEGGSILLRARAGAGTRIDALFGRDAPMVRALLIADQRAIDPAVKDRFAAAGIIHMLSISGLHVAIIAAAVRLLFLALRLRSAAATTATLCVVALYLAVIGAPPPALRSAVMLGAVALTRQAQRPVSAWAVLALGAAVPLVDPRTVTDLGYQLSVLGMASLIAGGILAKKWCAKPGGWRSAIATVALISTIATLASAPLVAWYFGRVSLIAPLTNIAATPVVAVLQPTLFLALALSPWPAAARFVAGAAHPMLAAFGAIATAGAAVPGASLHVAPTLAAAALAGAAAIAMLVACASYFPERALIVALAALAAAVWCPDVLAPPRGMELHVIDVGQGDAVAVRTPRGRWILTDAGRAWPGGDAGRSTVVPYLRRYGGAVALFVLTHPHADHAGGAATVMRALHPAAYWDGAFAGTSDPYHASLLGADSAGVPWHRAHPGDTIAVDGVVVRVLAPDSGWMAGLRDPNAASVVTLVEFGGVRFLLTGDAEAGEEDRLVTRYGASLHAAVLKVAHHGSKTSSTRDFLAAVHPRLAIISVGAGNTYGHPSAETLANLTRAGAAIVRTDRSGTVVVRTDGRSVVVDDSTGDWTLPPSP